MDESAFKPQTVRYIKLGQGGAWATEALQSGRLLFGYCRVAHADCLEENWLAVRNELRQSRTSSGATQGLREIQTFYEAPADTLWITFADGRLHWCFADGPAVSLENDDPDRPSRYRAALGGWKSCDLNGAPLKMQNLSSALTRTANYRATICEVERSDYLFRKIRGEPEPLVEQTGAVLEQLTELAAKMIRNLHWQDFETMVDLIFARDGWRRVSVLGEDQPDVDLILEHRTSNQTAWVQVKTSAGQAELTDYVGRFVRDGSCDRFYFVCGKPKGTLSLDEGLHMHLWADKGLARVALDAGLLNWIIERNK